MLVGMYSGLRLHQRYLLIFLQCIILLHLIRFVPSFALHEIDKATLAGGQFSQGSFKSTSSSLWNSFAVALLRRSSSWKIGWIAEQPVILSILVLELLQPTSQ